MSKTIILGAGVTGLAAGMTSGLPIREAAARPGGISTSYEKAGYQFSPGGGHWLFGSDPFVFAMLRSLCELRRYERRASVFFPNWGQQFVPYPIQHHKKPLSSGYLGQAQLVTMDEWLLNRFGPRLCEEFFYPFHEAYTAGLYTHIAPQDSYKSPGLNSRGYNATFAYPVLGLDHLVEEMTDRCGQIQYEKRVIWIDYQGGVIGYEDGEQEGYSNLISTLPLNRMMELTGLSVEARTDPHVSVQVLNIGAHRGPQCPDDHWLYIPQSKSGFHRVGFYSNVDRSFLPPKNGSERVSLYVECAYRDIAGGGGTMGASTYEMNVCQELQDWGFIEEVEVMDSTWVDVAYTYSWPNSNWRAQALQLLENHNIYQVGRYGRWRFQGIIESIREGLVAGAAFNC
jgi:protoporphyrinogen oxidase